MTTYVPAAYVGWVRTAAAKTGMPYAVVACQIDLESGFNPDAVSPAGAEGMAQFLPSTFRSYATGSPFNTTDAWVAYTNFMSALLAWSGGSIWKALAAYNAGQGNWQAGIGYADTILSCAGQGTGVKGNITQHTAPQYGPPPNATNSSDDWSSHIKHTADRLFTSARDTWSIGRAIRRM